MQRLGDVATLMNKVLNNIEVLAGNQNHEEMQSLKPLKPFDDNVILFFDGLSKLLMKDVNNFSDVTTFGFFSRKSNTHEQILFRMCFGLIYSSAILNMYLEHPYYLQNDVIQRKHIVFF